MPLFGSRSAQTINESVQDSSSSGDVGINLAQFMNMAVVDNAQYQVKHIWKPTVPGSPTHHSHLQVCDSRGNPQFHLGMFSVGGRAVVILRILENRLGAADYKLSTSYKPNPVTRSGRQIKEAYNYTIRKCGQKYNLLHNNCQKFARILMTKLGARHKRGWFHL